MTNQYLKLQELNLRHVVRHNTAYKFGLLLFCAILIGGFANDSYAQQTDELHEVTGTVTAASNGQSLPGVNITVMGKQRGTSTDMNGKYAIQATPADTLQFSFVGYQTKRIVVGNRQTINVKLASSAVESEELVVVGYGGQQRQDLTGSISSISSDQLEQSISPSLDGALQGKVAGMTVSQNSGKPGGGISVQIRGISSLGGNNQPLYVIDGVPVSGEAQSMTNVGGEQVATTNALATLDPSDIQNIEVLKDASATAIYGSRAANGVVLITTKSGESGQTDVSYSGYFGIQQLPNRVDVMDLQQFARFQNRRSEILDLTPNPEFADPSLLGKGTDWQDAMFRDAPLQKHNIRVSGGNDNTQYMLSAGYFDQEGIAVASWFERYNTRFNLDTQPTDWLNVGTRLNLSRTDERINVANNNLVNLAVRQRPDVPVKAPDGGWGGPDQAQFTLNNPVGMAKLREHYFERNQAIGNLHAEIHFTDNLRLRNEVDGTFTFTKDNQFNPTYEFGQRTNEINESSRSSSNDSFWMIKNYLTYQNTFQNVYDVKLMVGHEAQETSWEGLSGSRQNFPNNNVKELNAGDPNTSNNGSYAGSNALESFFSRVNLGYDDRYLFTGTIRADGSSKFGPKNRWGYFPSFSVAWRPSNEPYLQSLVQAAQISNLKLRVSYGEVGNQDIGNYMYGSTLNSYATPWEGSGFLPANLSNPLLKWESTKSYNAGIDLSLLNERIQFTGDAYIKKTDNLLLSMPLPPHAGTSGQGSLSPPTANIGAMENQGIELSLKTVNLNRELVWNTTLNFSKNYNEVTKMATESSVIDRTINQGSDVVSRTVVGEPAGQFYGYKVEGVFENAQEIQNSALPPDVPIDPNGVWVGDYKFKDINNDGVINDEDRTIIGNPQPDFTFGVGNDFYYKDFQLSIFINGKYGNDIFNDVRREKENPNSNFGLYESVTNFARVELKDPNGNPNNIEDVHVTNPNTNIPRITDSDANDNFRVSDRFVEDGSYLRVKNVTLGYTLAEKWTNVIGIQRARVYAKVENLLTITGYSGYDPDVGTINQDALMMGIDDGRYPSSRTYTFGVELNF